MFKKRIKEVMVGTRKRMSAKEIGRLFQPIFNVTFHEAGGNVIRSPVIATYIVQAENLDEAKTKAEERGKLLGLPAFRITSITESGSIHQIIP